MPLGQSAQEEQLHAFAGPQGGEFMVEEQLIDSGESVSRTPYCT